jgi:signal transduction histidine kinase/CheY-like chemotaxis protein
MKDNKSAAESLVEQLRLSQEQLYQAQKMKALGTLVAGVAHEINNPINLVMLNLPLLRKIWEDIHPILASYAQENPGRKYGGLTYDFLQNNLATLLADTELAAQRVARIVSGLKDFSRQSKVSDKKPVQLNTAIDDALSLVRTTLRKSGAQLQLDLAQDLPLMPGNLGNLEQIVINLLINAIEAIDHQHGKIAISTNFDSNKDKIFLTISDNGRGIDPAMAQEIFNPFATDKQREGGTGLGLAITYSLVQAHGGAIDFFSQQGQGTTFTVSFPTTTPGKRIKILLADDEEAIRFMLKKALSFNHRYQVKDASNGAEACIMLGTFKPDLLILDLAMPEMDGLEVCRAIKKEPDLSELKVIMITGFSDDPKIQEVVKLGFTEIYQKPLEINKFIQAVDGIFP